MPFIALILFLIVFLFFIAFSLFAYYGIRWQMACFSWYRQLIKRHGIRQGVLSIINPFSSWRNIRLIRQEIPGAEQSWRKTGKWMLVCLMLEGFGFTVVWYLKSN